MVAAKWEQKAFLKRVRVVEMVALKHYRKGGENEGDIILESNQGH